MVIMITFCFSSIPFKVSSRLIDCLQFELGAKLSFLKDQELFFISGTLRFCTFLLVVEKAFLNR